MLRYQDAGLRIDVSVLIIHFVNRPKAGSCHASLLAIVADHLAKSIVGGASILLAFGSSRFASPIAE